MHWTYKEQIAMLGVSILVLFMQNKIRIKIFILYYFLVKEFSIVA